MNKIKKTKYFKYTVWLIVLLLICQADFLLCTQKKKTDPEIQYEMAKKDYENGKYEKSKKRIQRLILVLNKKIKNEKQILKKANELLKRIRKKVNVIEKESPGPKKKKFPWLLVIGGIVVTGVLVYFLVIKKPKRTLTVNLGEGVRGNPPNGTHTYKKGDKVNYNYTLQDGYVNLIVTLDGKDADSSGTIIMDNNHQLAAATTKAGSIYVTSVPTEARIYLDGTDTQQHTNSLLRNVAPGSHTVKVSLPGYMSQEKAVTVESGIETPVDYTLNKLNRVITIKGKLGTKKRGQYQDTGQDAYKFYVGADCYLTIKVEYDSYLYPEYALYTNDSATGNYLDYGQSSEGLSYSVTSSEKYYSIAIEDALGDLYEKAGKYTITITSNSDSLGDYQQIKDEAAETLWISQSAEK